MGRRRVRPAPHTWRYLIPKLNGRQAKTRTPTSRPVGRSNPAPAPGRPRSRRHWRPLQATGGGGLPSASAPPSLNRQPALRHPRAPTRPARAPARSRPTALLRPPGRRERRARRARGALLRPGACLQVAGRGASRRAPPSSGPPACHLRVARRSRAPRGSVRARSAGARAARRPWSRPRARAGERGL